MNAFHKLLLCAVGVLFTFVTLVATADPYPKLKLYHYPDGDFYRVPVYTIDHQYQEIEIAVSKRRFFFCVEQPGGTNFRPGIQSLMTCVTGDEAGMLHSAQMAYVPVKDQKGEVEATTNTFKASTKPDLHKGVRGLSYTVPVSTLARTLETVEKPYQPKKGRYLFCNKMLNGLADDGRPRFNKECFIEKKGRVARVLEPFVPTEAELIALANFERHPPAEREHIVPTGPFQKT